MNFSIRHLLVATTTVLLVWFFTFALPTDPRDDRPVLADSNSARLKPVFTTDPSWSTHSYGELMVINAFATRSNAIEHARKRNIELEPTESVTQLLASQSRGTNANAARYFFVAEEPWCDEFERTGKGCLELMADRMKMLEWPARFTTEAEHVMIGGHAFYYADAEGPYLSNLKMKTRYICGYIHDVYVYFMLSYKIEETEDFKAMMDCVRSFDGFE